jgi:hypothetical protein
MSKVPYIVDVEEYICTALEQIRTMTKTLDFSSLPAVIERIQFHASSMENALYEYQDIRSGIAWKAKQEGMSDAEFRDYVKERLKKWIDNE